MGKSLAQRIIDARKRGPAWINRSINRVLASEKTVIRWVKSQVSSGEIIPGPLLPNTNATVRLLLGPFNYAGQAWLWGKDAMKHNNNVSAKCFATDTGGFGFEVDQLVPSKVFVFSSVWREQMYENLGAYTHVIIESFGSLFGRGTGKVILREIAEMRSRGIHVALLCHGSDIRSPAAHAARTPELPISEWGPDVKHLQRVADENRAVLDAFDGPVYISTPDLSTDVPEAEWLPVVVDVDRWAQAAQNELPPGKHEKLVVTHIPSSASMKGTVYVDAVANKMAAQRLITYKRLSGVPSKEMPATIAGSDIVIDQLMLGSYGVAACEAMAAERVVVGNVSDDVRQIVQETTGQELPIVQATSETLPAVLRRLIESPEKLTEVGRKGLLFVEAVHSGTWTHTVLAPFLTGSEGLRVDSSL